MEKRLETVKVSFPHFVYFFLPLYIMLETNSAYPEQLHPLLVSEGESCLHITKLKHDGNLF